VSLSANLLQHRRPRPSLLRAEPSLARRKMFNWLGGGKSKEDVMLDQAGEGGYCVYTLNRL